MQKICHRCGMDIPTNLCVTLNEDLGLYLGILVRQPCLHNHCHHRTASQDQCRDRLDNETCQYNLENDKQFSEIDMNSEHTQFARVALS